MVQSDNAKPFLKWAGGKTQLLGEINENLPEDLSSITTYIEPFVGGGSVMFDLVPRFPNIKKVIINDLNSKLINVYRNIKENPALVLARLSELEVEYYMYNKKGKEEMYYRIRDKFNERYKISTNKPVAYYLHDAAYFIFLNKTCFNGLYRENTKGMFNVPWNKSAKPKICDYDNIIAVSDFLNKYDVQCLDGDYKELTGNIGKDTFVYFDPPYRPLTKTSAFTSYTKSGFNDDSQKELSEFCKTITGKGCKLMLSNSDPKNSDSEDTFFDDLYEGFNIARVEAKRNINSKGNKRGKVTEILVTNYDKQNKKDIYEKK